MLSNSENELGCCPPVHTELSALIESVRRKGLSSAGKQLWFPLFPKIVLDGFESVGNFPNSTVMSERRFRLAIQALSSQFEQLKSEKLEVRLERPGLGKTRDLISILLHSNAVKVDELPCSLPFIYILCSFVTRIDCCFCIIFDVFRSTSWYLDLSVGEYRHKLSVFRDLFQTRYPKTYQALLKINGLQDVHLHHIFVGLFFSLLPLKIASRIFDSFMLEGEKILYRYGFALLEIYKREIKEGRFQSGVELWAYIKENAGKLDYEYLSDVAFDRSIPMLSKLRRHKLSRQTILALKDDYRAKADLNIMTRRSLKSENEKLRFEMSVVATSVISHHHNRLNDDEFASSQLLDTNSKLILKSFLQAKRGRPNLAKMELKFSSKQHGFSLSALYDQVKNFSPCLILMKSSESDITFGSFLSCPLICDTNDTDGKDDNSDIGMKLNCDTVRGDYRSCIFKLDNHKSLCYCAADHTAYRTLKDTPSNTMYDLINAIQRKKLTSENMNERSFQNPFILTPDNSLLSTFIDSSDEHNAKRSFRGLIPFIDGSDGDENNLWDRCLDVPSQYHGNDDEDPKDNNDDVKTSIETNLTSKRNYVICAPDCISIGFCGGEVDNRSASSGAISKRRPRKIKDLPCAIRLQSDLRWVYCDASDTFGNNTALCSDGNPKINNGMFAIGSIEVYCGVTAAESYVRAADTELDMINQHLDNENELKSTDLYNNKEGMKGKNRLVAKDKNLTNNGLQKSQSNENETFTGRETLNEESFKEQEKLLLREYKKVKKFIMKIEKKRERVATVVHNIKAAHEILLSKNEKFSAGVPANMTTNSTKQSQANQFRQFFSAKGDSTATTDVNDYNEQLIYSAISSHVAKRGKDIQIAEHVLSHIDSLLQAQMEEKSRLKSEIILLKRRSRGQAAQQIAQMAISVMNQRRGSQTQQKTQFSQVVAKSTSFRLQSSGEGDKRDSLTASELQVRNGEYFDEDKDAQSTSQALSHRTSPKKQKNTDYTSPQYDMGAIYYEQDDDDDVIQHQSMADVKIENHERELSRNSSFRLTPRQVSTSNRLSAQNRVTSDDKSSKTLTAMLKDIRVKFEADILENEGMNLRENKEVNTSDPSCDTMISSIYNDLLVEDSESDDSNDDSVEWIDEWSNKNRQESHSSSNRTSNSNSYPSSDGDIDNYSSRKVHPNSHSASNKKSLPYADDNNDSNRSNSSRPSQKPVMLDDSDDENADAFKPYRQVTSEEKERDSDRLKFAGSFFNKRPSISNRLSTKQPTDGNDSIAMSTKRFIANESTEFEM